MREVWFRGKRLDNGEWVFGGLNWHRTGKAFIKRGSANHLYEVDPQTVGEFTGVLDKCGTKVFEGDVCKSVYYRKPICGPVVFYRGSFGISFEGQIWELLNMLSADIEVIGNRHEEK